MAAFFLLLLPALTISDIEVFVTGQYKGAKSDLRVYYSGSLKDIITDKDKDIFKINDKTLKNAARDYIKKKPNDVFLHGPTPWGDVHSLYKWNPVIRTIIPKSGRVLKISSMHQILKQENYKNNGTEPMLVDIGIHEDVHETVSSSWNPSCDMWPRQNTTYKFVLDIKPDKKYLYDYNGTFGHDYVRNRTVLVGATSQVKVNVDGGESAVATLEVTKTTILVEIEYEVKLTGIVVANYAFRFKGHHFWGLDIESLMVQADRSNRLTCKEVMELNFYITYNPDGEKP